MSRDKSIPLKMTPTCRSLKGITESIVEIDNECDPIISGIQIDSRKVKKSDLFLAFPGEIADGRDFIDAAINQGASAVLFEALNIGGQHFAHKGDLHTMIPVLPVKDVAKNAGYFAANFYGQPSKKMKVLGITGTNGKTSCSHLLSEALTYLGKTSALIGTLGSGLWGSLSKNINTTPDPVSLQKSLSAMHRDGAEYVAMEVSSHGLDQGRVNGIDYHTAILTNISRDHLDYHGTMANYTRSKEQLFSCSSLKYGILSTDDAGARGVFERLQAQSSFEVIGVGRDVDLKFGRGIKITNVEINGEMIVVQFKSSWGDGELNNSNLCGAFNVENLLLTLAALLTLGFSFDKALGALTRVQGIPGRMEKLGGGELPRVFVDYAHTPDALQCALTAAKAYGSNKLICVFGCGGDRDQGKRAEMGVIACEQADEVIVTADNPRSESVESICQQILSGVGSRAHCQIIQDRAQAIEQAIRTAGVNDVVLVAGKGAETYQEVDGKRCDFSDRDVISVELARRAA
ncbi:MAG: UDP-N-acetylmuramoyl-L-alanyl-D-glutamate--2,6-diaminopimelate ligase [Gammaproteobacteria bacterium]|nr:UDP-N-acetylmuramoyl-L-alanyl-D-glutamate--2,6-diaminopimelate ligase [Gammaproteobacteria bacterium]